MTIPILFSDLDKTLIYSNTVIKNHNHSSAGTLVVEEHEDKPLSFMSLETWKMLAANAGSTFQFIPTTTRTLRQFRRISFPDVRFNTAIVLNGARILVDGIEDYSWTKHVAAEVKKEDWHPVKLWDRVQSDLQGVPDVLKVVNADDFFVYIVSRTPHNPVLDNYTKTLAKETGYIHSHQGRKTYLIPSAVDKGKAVAEVVERYKPSMSFATGDSELDLAMLPQVDHFIQPAHWEGTPESAHSLQTTQRGIKASEDILKMVLQKLTPHHP